ncbi:MAG: magnesium transporter CorA family protein [Candidatus Nealsonbacteria bacterium]
MKNIITGEKVTWIDIQDPTNEDIKYLEDNFNFHPLVLEELSNFGYRPKVEAYEDYLFMTFYYPVHMKETRETRPREIDIIITKDVIITSHYKSILPLKSLFDKCNLYPEIRKKYMGGSAGYILFLLLNELWKNCLIKLDRLNLKLETIEKEMFEGKEKEMVREISFVKTDLINFWRIIEPQNENLESLSKEGVIYFGEEFAPYFSDIIATYKKSWNSLQTFKETILAMEDTNQSLLSTKTNEVIQVLTVFSAVMLPLTLIASMWGMNLKIPFDKSPLGFWIILLIMIFLMGLLIIYFRKKKWM